jgi:hypothetical protein
LSFPKCTQNGFNLLRQTNFVFPFAFSIFGFVSDFDIRASDLTGAHRSGFARFGFLAGVV